MERREFGRKSAAQRAWVVVPGHIQWPCVIRNISPKGGMLEMDVPVWLPNEFKLEIEGKPDVIQCRVRHTAVRRVGVTFVKQEGNRLAEEVFEAQTWHGPGSANRTKPRPTTNQTLLARLRGR